MSFDEELKTRIARNEEIVSAYLPDPADYGARVMEAMNYSFLAGGKRIRPMLMIETHILCGGDGRLVAPFMAALEMIHTYSLIHDDLPAMDGDELRRGMPTTWKQYDEATAILAGDGLLNYSVETAALAFDMAEDHEDYIRVAASMKILYHHAGIYGMIGGQCADIAAEEMSDLPEDMLIYIHRNKTAALIRAAMTIGAVLAGADEDVIRLIDRAADCIGLAFQIQDDLLDVTSTDEALGKPVGSDERNNKTTYITLHGIDESRAAVERLSNEALDIIRDMRHRNEFLEELITWMIHRDR